MTSDGDYRELCRNVVHAEAGCGGTVTSVLDRRRSRELCRYGGIRARLDDSLTPAPTPGNGPERVVLAFRRRLPPAPVSSRPELYCTVPTAH